MIGAYVASRIFIDAVGLSRDAISSMKGEDTDLSKYKMPLAKYKDSNMLMAFRFWIVYYLVSREEKRREHIIDSLYESFNPYIPFLNEIENSKFKFEFEIEFDNLIQPLLDEELIKMHGEKFFITKKESYFSLKYVKISVILTCILLIRLF